MLTRDLFAVANLLVFTKFSSWLSYYKSFSAEYDVSHVVDRPECMLLVTNWPKHDLFIILH